MGKGWRRPVAPGTQFLMYGSLRSLRLNRFPHLGFRSRNSFFGFVLGASPDIRNRKPETGAPASPFELLVVITIIAVLAALLLPTLALAKARATQIKCTSNLRQMNVGLQLYLADQSVYPLATTGNGLGCWQNAILPLTSSNVLYCPQLIPALPAYLTLTGSSEKWVLPHYGYNVLGAVWSGFADPSLGLGGDFDPDTTVWTAERQARVSAPAQMIDFGDSGAYLQPPVKQTNSAVLLYIAYPYPLITVNRLAIGFWHNSGANMAFCDGHVEYGKQSYWAGANDGLRSLWNNDHQPHEEFW